MLQPLLNGAKKLAEKGKRAARTALIGAAMTAAGLGLIPEKARAAEQMTGFVNGVAAVQGLQGADWHTDLWIHNGRNDYPVTVRLFYAPQGTPVNKQNFVQGDTTKNDHNAERRRRKHVRHARKRRPLLPNTTARVRGRNHRREQHIQQAGQRQGIRTASARTTMDRPKTRTGRTRKNSGRRRNRPIRSRTNRQPQVQGKPSIHNKPPMQQSESNNK